MTGREQPTATGAPRDMSEAERASAAPASPEAQLFRAYGNIEPGQRGMFRVTSIRHEPCACGEVITTNADLEVQRAVDDHNQSEAHQSWRARQ